MELRSHTIHGRGRKLISDFIELLRIASIVINCVSPKNMANQKHCKIVDRRSALGFRQDIGVSLVNHEWNKNYVSHNEVMRNKEILGRMVLMPWSMILFQTKISTPKI